MPTIFRQVEKDGETTFEEVDLSEVLTEDTEIPESVLRAQALFQQVDSQRQSNLEESIERRKRIQALQAALESQSAQNGEPEGSNPPPPAPSGATTLSPEEIVAQAVAELEKRQSARAEAENTRRSAIAKAMKDYNLPRDAEPLFSLVGENDIETAAQALSAAGLKFPTGGAGEGTTGNPVKEHLASLDNDFETQFFGDDKRGTFAKQTQ